MKTLFALVVSLGLAAGAAQACSIPVFRYALDRWPADKYRLEIGASATQQEDVARFLRNFTDSTPLNLEPVRLPTGDESRLLFPHEEKSARPAWSGTLDAGALALITASPARAEIARRILAGESAVWVLVENGPRSAGDAAAAVVEKRLRYLEQVAQTPAIDPNDPTSRLGPGPALRVKFSLLRLRGDDPAEQAFFKMLAGPKAPVPTDAPWLAAVFGRGRVLGAWAAEGFGDEQIEEVCLFLLGACSCEVKRLNPGWDLLLDTDWNAELQAIGYPAVAAAASSPPAEPTPAVASQPETVTITPAAAPIAPAPAATSPLAIAAGGLLVLGGALAWRTMRKS